MTILFLPTLAEDIRDVVLTPYRSRLMGSISKNTYVCFLTILFISFVNFNYCSTKKGDCKASLSE